MTRKIGKFTKKAAGRSTKKAAGKSTKKTAGKSNGVAQVAKLPISEDQLSVVRMKRAVRYINTRERIIGVRVAEVGNHIIDNFFFGDLERVRSRNPMKGFSLGTLSRQEGMRMSRSQLQRCVTVAALERELAGVKGLSFLSVKHKLLLATVEERKQKKADVRTIRKEKLTVDAYRELLEARRHPDVPDLHPDFTRFVKKYESVRSALRTMDPESIGRLTGRQRRTAVMHLEEIQRMLDELKDAAEIPAGGTRTLKRV